MQKFSQWVLRMIGWKTVALVAEPPKSVICVAPHTSNWDFVIGKLYYWSLNRKSSFLGGVAVDRSKHTSVTDQMAEEFNKRENFHLAITPEGTRKLVKIWKMGFYHIAVKANVPVQLAYIDYGKKEMGITTILYPTGDEKADLERIQAFYSNVSACHPDKFDKNK